MAKKIKKIYDVAIIGAGVIGSSTSLHLSRLGYNADGSKKGFKVDHRPASNVGKKYSLQEKLASISKKR